MLNSLVQAVKVKALRRAVALGGVPVTSLKVLLLVRLTSSEETLLSCGGLLQQLSLRQVERSLFLWALGKLRELGQSG